jgi:Carboxypeptidase regulatory-like domain/TonB dependent receptor-like, beta-barrel
MMTHTRRIPTHRRIVSLSLVAAALAGWCAAQNSATISGSVKDTKGEPVAAVKLVVAGQHTSVNRTLQSEADGTFVVPELPPDRYQIDASCATCADLSTTVEIGAGQNRRVELQVSLGTASTTISLDTEATTLDTASARLGTNVTAPEILGLPVNGGTYAPLELGAPGAANGGMASFGDVRFHGQSTEQNRFTLDGVDSSAVVSASPGFSAAPGLQFRLRTSVDSIQEFRVDSAATPANQGGATGAQIMLVSKAGEEMWHGTLFEHFRNGRLAARNFFDEFRPDLHLNQFGATAGGRLGKKLFVLGSYEALRQRVALNALEAVPSSAEFADAQASIAAIQGAFPSGTAVGNGDSEVARRNGRSAQDETSYSVRFDYLPSTNNRLFVRVQRASGTLDTPDQTVCARNLDTDLHSHHVVASWHLTAGTFLNEFLAGFNSSPTVMRADAGTPLLQGQRIFIGDTNGGVVSPGGLTMLPTGDFGSGTAFHGRSYQLGNRLTWLRGQHNIQAGLASRSVRAPVAISGGMSFRYQSVESALENEDTDITLLGDLPRHEAARQEYAAFAQDEWRISPDLTLNFGLRYEYFGPTREVADRARLFDLESYSFEPVDGGFYPVSRTGFTPRFGLAWAPHRLAGKTVVRFGAGVFQGGYALLDTLGPILNDGDRYVLIGGTFPSTPKAVIENPDAQIAPRGLDTAGFRHNLTNYHTALSLQQVLPGKFVGQAAFIAGLGRHLTQLGAANLTIGVDEITGHPHRAHDEVTGIDVVANGGRSSYNALELGLTRRFVDDFTMNVSYTWAHSIGDTQGAGDTTPAQNPTCLACERSDNDFDVRHTVNASVIYALPFGSGRRHLSHGPVAALVGGWSVGGMWNARTGLPVNVTINRPDEIWYDRATGVYLPNSAELSETAIPVVNVPGGGEGRPALRPNLVAGVDPYIRKGGLLWLNAAAFAAPLPGQFGSLGRNSLRGPGMSQIDLQISRSFKLSERHALTFRAEAYNLLNHTNYANPAAVLPDELEDLSPGKPYSAADAGGFGLLNSTVGRTVGLGTSRQVQLSLRYQF